MLSGRAFGRGRERQNWVYLPLDVCMRAVFWTDFLSPHDSFVSWGLSSSHSVSITNRHNLNHRAISMPTTLSYLIAPLPKTSHYYVWLSFGHQKLDDTKTCTNGEKIEAIFVGTRQKLSFISANILHQLDDQYNSPTLWLSKFNPRLLLDSIQIFMSQNSKSCHYKLRRIRSVRKHLSTGAATMKLDRRLTQPRTPRLLQFSLFGLPASSVHRFYHIQNCADRLPLK